MDFVDFFFSPTRPESLVLNLIILGLAAVALIQVLSGLFNELPREEEAIKQVQEKGFRDADSYTRIAAELPKSTAVAKRLAILRSLHEQKERIANEALTAITTESFRRKIEFARYMTTILVLLGLGGTVLGLAISISGVLKLVQGEVTDAAQLRSAITAAVQGMATAFSTTLAGVMGAVLVGAAVGVYRHRQSRILTNLEVLSTLALIPAHEVKEEVSLQASSESLAQSTAKLAGQLDTLTLAVQAFRQAITDTSNLIPDLRDSIREEVQKQTTQLHDAIAGSVSQMAEQLRLQTDLTSKLTEEMTRTSGAVGEVATSVSGFAEASKRYKEMWQDVVDALGRAENVVADHIERGLKSIDAHLRGAQEREAQIQDSVLRALQDVDGQLAETLQVLAEERRRTSQRSEELIHELQDQVKRGAKELAAAMERREDRLGTKVEQAMRELGRELRDLLRSGGVSGKRERLDEGVSLVQGTGTQDGDHDPRPTGASDLADGDGPLRLTEEEEERLRDMFEGEA